MVLCFLFRYTWLGNIDTLQTVASAFPLVHSYRVDIPSFADAWGFNLAAEDGKGFPDAAELDRRIAANISGGAWAVRCAGWPIHARNRRERNPFPKPQTQTRIVSHGAAELEWLDGSYISSMLVLPKAIKTALAKEEGVFTEEEPKFLAHGTGLKAGQ